jgi:hypothetical protein
MEDKIISIENQIEEISDAIENENFLQPNAKLKDVIVAINDIYRDLQELKNRKPVHKIRNTGAISERPMNEDDATRILVGDLKDLGHNEAAKILNLSYGQVYSVRKGFTFKAVRRALRNKIVDGELESNWF